MLMILIKQFYKQALIKLQVKYLTVTLEKTIPVAVKNILG